MRNALAAVDLVVTTEGSAPRRTTLLARPSLRSSTKNLPWIPELERRLRLLFERRGISFPEMNVKQAWLIPSARAIPNDRGTAPGGGLPLPGTA